MVDLLALGVESVVIGGAVQQAIYFCAFVLLTRASVRHYRWRMSLTVLDDVPRAFAALLAAVGLTVVTFRLTSHTAMPGASVVQRAALFFTLSLALQAAVYTVTRRRRRERIVSRRTLVVGGGRVGRTLVDAMFAHPELGLTPVGLVDPSGRSTATEQGTMPVLTTDMTRLARTIVENEIDTTVLALEDAEEHVDAVITVHQTGCEVLIVPPMFEMHHDGPDVERIRGIPLIRLRPDPTLRPTWWIKRGVDVAVGALGLLVLALPLAVIAVMILIDSGRPVMFWQERIGLDGRTFRLCKFRSMRPRSEQESQTTWNIAQDPRVGRVGKFLRRTSIDEIPQLWNIMRGQMSLVGPRPERPGFVEKFSQEHERYWARHRVPVGLTGLAQVNGLRGDTSIRERARYDNYYIANWSLWLDLKILLLTVREVLGGHGG